jgi:hypothetical protein
VYFSFWGVLSSFEAVYFSFDSDKNSFGEVYFSFYADILEFYGVLGGVSVSRGGAEGKGAAEWERRKPEAARRPPPGAFPLRATLAAPRRLEEAAMSPLSFLSSACRMYIMCPAS